MADGNVMLKTGLDNSALQKEINETKKDLQELKWSAQDIGKSSKQAVKDANQALSDYEKQITSAEKALKKMRDAEKEVDVQSVARAEIKEDLGRAEDKASKLYKGMPGYETANQNVADLKARYKEAGVELARLNEILDNARDSYREQYNLVQRSREQYEGLKQKASEALTSERDSVLAIREKERQLADLKVIQQGLSAGIKKEASERAEAEKQAKSMAKESAKEGKESGSMLDFFANRVKRLLGTIFVFNLIANALRKVKDYILQNAMANQQAVTAFAQLRGALATLAQPLLNILIPALTWVINLVTTAINTIIYLFSLLGVRFEGAAKSARNVGKSAGGATKQAEKMKKAFADFDEIKQLDTQQDDSAGGGGGGGGIGFDFSNQDMFDLSALDGFATKIAEAFKTGFELAFNDRSLEPIRQGLDTIRQDLVDIFTNPQLVGAMEFFVTGFAGMLGGFTGMLANIGVTIGQLLVGGFVDFLSNSKESILQGFTNAFNLVGEIEWQLAELFANIGIFLEPLGGELAQSILWNILSTLWTAVSTFFTIGAQIVLEILNGINVSIASNMEGLHEVWNSLLSPINTALEALRMQWEEIGQKWQEVYNTFIGPAIQDFMSGIGEIVAYLTEAWNTYMSPVLQAIGDGVAELIDGPVGESIEKAIEFVGRVVQVVEMLWDIYLKPIVKWIGGHMVKGIASALEAIWGVVSDIVSYISEQVGNILDVLNGLLQFVAGVFTGDWESAWDGIVSAFKGIMNGVITAAESAVNFVINGINNIGFDIPSWVPKIGGSHFGLALSPVSLPRLATGAVIPPNQSFLAVLGDQKQGTNVEAPLSTIEQALRNVLVERGNTDNEAVLEIDGEAFGRIVYRLNNRQQRKVGVDLAEVL